MVKCLLLVVALTVAASAQKDPFAGLDVAVRPQPRSATTSPALSWARRFFKDNFGFRKEVLLQLDTNEEGEPASRESLGLEALKKFSTATATIGAFDIQARLVRRDGFNHALNDMEGRSRGGWSFEFHNLYLDLYNVFNPLLSDKQRGANIGRFNFRAGHFYVPFGLNLQTDTHGTVLQLSNDRNFGFERDWYTGLWGSINRHLNYDVYYLAGSGYSPRFKGQSGLGSARISLSNRYSSKYGLEAGISFLSGERLSSEAIARSPRIAASTGASDIVATRRAGIDGRFRRSVPRGLLTFTSELSAGYDRPDRVFTQLYQSEFLHSSRRWGLAAQYRRFSQQATSAEASVIGEISWYLKNDPAGANAHWIKLNVEHQLERVHAAPRTIVTLQYYFYR